MVAGCAAQQNVAPQYRLSAPSVQAVDGASMLQRGRAQLDAGLDALAIESFRAEIRFNPEQVDAYNGLGVAYGRIGRNDLAQRYFEIALAKDPMNARVQANMAKLPGNARSEITQLASLPAATSVEPVAVTAEAGGELETKIVTGDVLPSLTDSQIVSEPHSKAPSGEILQKRGVLSARYTLASAGVTKDHAGGLAIHSIASVAPVKRPVPVRERPAPYVQSEIRVAARLERVSLNEVRLITLSAPTPLRGQRALEFDSFGDRLALWLPAYMSAEQAASRYRGDEKTVVVAVAENSGAKRKAAVSPTRLVAELPELAYIMFDDDNGIAGT